MERCTPATLELEEPEAPAGIPQLRLVVRLDPRLPAFFNNLWELIRPSAPVSLDLTYAPAPFWPDVFVARGLPWRRFFQSGAYHVSVLALLWAASHFLAFAPQAVAHPVISHEDVIYYTPSEYLPPLDTRVAQSSPPAKADPEYAPQPIISVPPEADNRSQTIVTPPNVKLNRDVPLPNVVAWADQPDLPIGPPPLVPASSITRLAPRVENSVVAPPPVARPDQHRTITAMQANVVAPPPNVDAAAASRISGLNIGRSAVIAPAPLLPVDAQRALAGGNSSAVPGLAPQVVAPPPSLGTTRSAASGSRRMVALNLHPAVGAPPDPPAGNRRGTFAAGPEGHHGAPGTPGASTGESSGTDGHGLGNGAGNGGSNKAGNLPSGLYVGKAANQPTSAVAGDPAPNNAVNPNLLASVRPRASPRRPARSHRKASPNSLSPSAKSSTTAASTPSA